VGVKPGVVVGDVCKVLFQKLYSVGHTYVDEIIFEIKVINVNQIFVTDPFLYDIEMF